MNNLGLVAAALVACVSFSSCNKDEIATASADEVMALQLNNIDTPVQ